MRVQFFFTNMDSFLTELLFLTSPAKPEQRLYGQQDEIRDVVEDDFILVLTVLAIVLFCVFTLSLICCRSRKRPVKPKILAKSANKVVVLEYNPSEDKINQKSTAVNATQTNKQSNTKRNSDKKSLTSSNQSRPTSPKKIKPPTNLHEENPVAQGDHPLIHCSSVHSKTAVEERVFLCSHERPKDKNKEDVSHNAGQTDTSKSIIVLKRSIFSKTNRPIKNEENENRQLTVEPKIMKYEHGKHLKIKRKDNTRKAKNVEPGLTNFENANQIPKKNSDFFNTSGICRQQMKYQSFGFENKAILRRLNVENPYKLLARKEHSSLDLPTKSPFTKVCFGENCYVDASPIRKTNSKEDSKWLKVKGQTPLLEDYKSKSRNVKSRRKEIRCKTSFSPVKSAIKPYVVKKIGKSPLSPPLKRKRKIELKENNSTKLPIYIKANGRILNRPSIKHGLNDKKQVTPQTFPPDERIKTDYDTHFARPGRNKHPIEVRPSEQIQCIRNKEKISCGMPIQPQERQMNRIQYGLRLSSPQDRLIKANVTQLCKTTSKSKLYTSLVNKSEKKQFNNYGKQNMANEVGLHLFYPEYGIKDSYKMYKNSIITPKQQSKINKSKPTQSRSLKQKCRNKAPNQETPTLPIKSGKKCSSRTTSRRSREPSPKLPEKVWREGPTIKLHCLTNERSKTLHSFLDEKEMKTNEVKNVLHHTKQESPERWNSREEKNKDIQLESNMSPPRKLSHCDIIDKADKSNFVHCQTEETILPIEVTEENIYPILDLLKNQRDKERNELIQYFSDLTPRSYIHPNVTHANICTEKENTLSKDSLSEVTANKFSEHFWKHAITPEIIKSDLSSKIAAECNNEDNTKSFTATVSTSKSKPKSIYSLSSSKAHNEIMTLFVGYKETEQTKEIKSEVETEQVDVETKNCALSSKQSKILDRSEKEKQMSLSLKDTKMAHEHVLNKQNKDIFKTKSLELVKTIHQQQSSAKKDLLSKTNDSKTDNKVGNIKTKKAKKLKKKSSPCLSERIQASLSTLRRETIAFRNKIRPALQGKKGKIIKGNNTFGEKIQSQTYSEIEKAMNLAKTENYKKLKLPNLHTSKGNKSNKNDLDTGVNKNNLLKDKDKTKETTKIDKPNTNTTIPTPKVSLQKQNENSFTIASHKKSNPKKSPFGNLIDPKLSCSFESGLSCKNEIQQYNYLSPPRSQAKHAMEYVYQSNPTPGQRSNSESLKSHKSKASKGSLRSRKNSTPLIVENYSFASNSTEDQRCPTLGVLGIKEHSLSLRKTLDTDRCMEDFSFSVSHTNSISMDRTSYKEQNDEALRYSEVPENSDQQLNLLGDFDAEKRIIIKSDALKIKETATSDFSESFYQKTKPIIDNQRKNSKHTTSSDCYSMMDYENMSDLLNVSAIKKHSALLSKETSEANTSSYFDNFVRTKEKKVRTSNTTSKDDGSEQVEIGLITLDIDQDSNSHKYLSWNIPTKSLINKNLNLDGCTNLERNEDILKTMKIKANYIKKYNLNLQEQKNTDCKPKPEISTFKSANSGLRLCENPMPNVKENGDDTLQNIIHDFINEKALGKASLSHNGKPIKHSEEISHLIKKIEIPEETKEINLNKRTVSTKHNNHELNKFKNNSISLQDVLLAIFRNKTGNKLNKHPKRCVKQSHSMENLSKSYFPTEKRFGSFHKPWGIKNYMSHENPNRFVTMKEYKGISLIDNKGSQSFQSHHARTDELTEPSHLDSFFDIKGMTGEIASVTGRNKSPNSEGKDYSDLIGKAELGADINGSHIKIQRIHKASSIHDIINNEKESHENLYSSKRNSNEKVSNELEKHDKKNVNDMDCEKVKKEVKSLSNIHTDTNVMEPQRQPIDGKAINSKTIQDTSLILINSKVTIPNKATICKNDVNENSPQLRQTVSQDVEIKIQNDAQCQPLNEQETENSSSEAHCIQPIQPVPVNRGSDLQYSMQAGKDNNISECVAKLSPRHLAINNKRTKLKRPKIKRRTSTHVSRVCNQRSDVIHYLPPLSPSPDRNQKPVNKQYNKETNDEEPKTPEKLLHFNKDVIDSPPTKLSTIREYLGEGNPDSIGNNQVLERTTKLDFPKCSETHERCNQLKTGESVVGKLTQNDNSNYKNDTTQVLDNYSARHVRDETVIGNCMGNPQNNMTPQSNNLSEEVIQIKETNTLNSCLRNNNDGQIKDTDFGHENILDDKNHQDILSQNNTFKERDSSSIANIIKDSYDTSEQTSRNKEIAKNNNDDYSGRLRKTNLPTLDLKGHRKSFHPKELETNGHTNNMQDLESILLSEINDSSSRKCRTGHVFWDSTPRKRRQVRSQDQICGDKIQIDDIKNKTDTVSEFNSKHLLKEFQKPSIHLINKMSPNYEEGKISSCHADANGSYLVEDNSTQNAKLGQQHKNHNNYSKNGKPVTQKIVDNKDTLFKKLLTDNSLKNNQKEKIKNEYQNSRKTLIETSDKPNSREAVKSAKRLAGTLEEYLLSTGQDENQHGELKREFKNHASFKVFPDSQCSCDKPRFQLLNKPKCPSEIFVSKRKSLDNQIHKSISERICEFSKLISTNEVSDRLESSHCASSDGIMCGEHSKQIPSLPDCILEDERAANHPFKPTNNVKEIKPFDKVAKRRSKTSVMSSDIDLSWAESTLESTFTWLTEPAVNDNTNHTDYFIHEEEIIIKNSRSLEDILSEQPESDIHDVFQKIEEISSFQKSYIGNDLKSFFLFDESNNEIKDLAFNGKNVINNEQSSDCETFQSDDNRHQEYNYEVSLTSCQAEQPNNSNSEISASHKSYDASTSCKAHWTKLGGDYVISAWSHEITRKQADLVADTPSEIK